MNFLLSQISLLDPWWVVSVAVVLVIFSFTVFEGEYLLSASGGLILWALLLSFPLSPILKLVVLPPCLFASYFAQVRLIRKVSVDEIPMEQEPKSKIGKQGLLKVIELDASGEDFYYKYKSTISGEAQQEKSQPVVRYRVLLESGETLDAAPLYETPKAGDAVITVAIENGSAIVEKVN